MSDVMRTGPQSIAGHGFTVFGIDRFSEGYKEDSGRELRIPTELITVPFLREGEAPYRRVRLNLVKSWNPPHQGEPFTEDDRKRVRDRLAMALDILLPGAYRIEG